MYNTVVNYLIEGGIDEVVVFLVILMPFILTFVMIVKYIIGLKLERIELSLILTFIMYSFGSVYSFSSKSDFRVGIPYGLAAILITFVSTLLSYTFLKKFRLHKLVKYSLSLSFSFFTVFLTLIIAANLSNSTIIKTNFIHILMITLLGLEILEIRSKNSTKTTINNLTENTFIAIIIYVILTSAPISNYMLTYPLIALLVIPLLLFVGTYKGLRLFEFIRFYDILLGDNTHTNEDTLLDENLGE